MDCSSMLPTVPPPARAAGSRVGVRVDIAKVSVPPVCGVPAAALVVAEPPPDAFVPDAPQLLTTTPEAARTQTTIPPRRCHRAISASRRWLTGSRFTVHAAAAHPPPV